MQRTLALAVVGVVLASGAAPALGAATVDGPGHAASTALGEPRVAHHLPAAAGARPTLAGPENNTTRHENPELVDRRGDLGTVARWLEGAMGDRLVEGTVRLSRGQADAARELLGEAYAERLGQYVDVAGRTDDAADDRQGERFRETRETQREYTDAVERYRRTHEEYEDARASGNEARARELARELERVAARVERLDGNLQADYENLTDETAADLGPAATTVAAITANVTETQAAVVEETFVATRLSLEPADGTVSFLDPLALSGRLTAENGTALAGRTVALRVGGRTLRPTTDADGAFSATYRPVALPVGERTVTVRYRPRNESVYLGTAAEVTVTIEQVVPDLAVAVEPTTARFADAVSVDGRVTAEGTAVPGVPVAVWLGDAKLGTSRTAADGSFAVEGAVPAGVDDGDRTLRVTVPYEGRAIAGVDRNRTVTVRPTATAMSVAGEQVGPRAVRVDGTLVAGEGAPVGGQPVVVRLAGEPVGTLRTDGSGAFGGVVSVPAALLPEDGNATLRLVARFDRPETNLRASRAEAAVALSAAGPGDGPGDGGPDGRLPTPEWLPWPLLALVAGVALAGVAGAYAVARRRGAAGSAGSTGEPDAGGAAAAERPPTVGAELLDAADERLTTGDADRAVELAYAAARHALVADLGVDGAGTHWEFLEGCRATDLDGAALSALRDLTEGYEAAAFAPATLDADAARSALSTARTLTGDDRVAG